MVFQTYTANGPASLAFNSSSPPLPSAITGFACDGAGISVRKASSSWVMPTWSLASARKTGTKIPLRTTPCKPCMISSAVSSPVSRYFSSNLSEPSAAASTNCMRAVLAASATSAGISSAAPPPTGNAFITIRSMMPLKPMPSPQGSCTGIRRLSVRWATESLA